MFPWPSDCHLYSYSTVVAPTCLSRMSSWILTIFASLGWPSLPASKRDNEEGVNFMEILGGGHTFCGQALTPGACVTCCLYHHIPVLLLQEDPGWNRAYLGLQLRSGQCGRQRAAVLLWGHWVQRTSSLTGTSPLLTLRTRDHPYPRTGSSWRLNSDPKALM